MVKKIRSRKGQSMVEYGIGIGCVTAVCMMMLGGLGHASADIIQSVLTAINDTDDQQQDPGSVFKPGSTPWQPK